MLSGTPAGAVNWKVTNDYGMEHEMHGKLVTFMRLNNVLVVLYMPCHAA